MDNPTMIREMQGPILNDGSPQSKYAPAFLRLVIEMVLSDLAYIERLKRHYQIFKETVAPKHFGKPGAGKQHIPERRLPCLLLLQHPFTKSKSR